MNTKMKITVGVLFSILLVGISFTGIFLPNEKNTISPKSSIANAEKQSAPNFTVFDLQGNAVQLSDFIGKPIVLNFWASWCPPCKGEMPHFNKIYEEEQGNIVFLMVDLVDGNRETVASGQKYVNNNGFTFPVYFDTSGEAGNTYRISAVPTTIFIDREGNIVSKARGAITENYLRAHIDKIR